MRNKKFYITISAILAVLLFFLGYTNYENNKKKSITFRLTESSIEMHSYLFERTKVHGTTLLELLKNCLKGDSLSIVKFSTIELVYVLPNVDLDKEEKSKLYYEYIYALWAVIDKTGDERFYSITKSLPIVQKLQIRDNLGWSGNKGELFELYELSKKYPLTRDSL